jgi:hypothetical protein
MPDSRDSNALVPVIVEDSYGAVPSDQVNPTVSFFYEFAVGCKIARIDFFKINVGF